VKVKGGRLEFLVPHLLRSQMLRPGFVRLSLKLGVAQQMPAWAKLQFINGGVDPDDLERVLGSITSLESWVDEWENLGITREQAAYAAIESGAPQEAVGHLLRAASAYNFAQYVVFLDTRRKRALHEACVRAYAMGAPLFDPPAIPFDVTFRRRPMKGFLRLPPGRRPAPVLVLFNGTNAVKEEMHWWSDAALALGLATITFDGPGLGETFHRLSMVGEPRPVGVEILNQIETRPELDPRAVGFLGMSLGGYLAIRMAAHDRRVKAVAAVSPPYSADIYWNVTLSGLRRELAGLYSIDEREMAKVIDRITLADALPVLSCPLMVSGGGHDHITPGTEAWRIYEDACCDREIVYYPQGAHDCFNVIDDLRPRMVSWMAHQLERHAEIPRPGVNGNGNGHGAWNGNGSGPALARDADAFEGNGHGPGHGAAEAVDPEFGDALCGDIEPRVWNRAVSNDAPATFDWPWARPARRPVEVVHQKAPRRS
jgi:2,6-dihydroxypseudooxynicotine hydrolase